MPRSQYLDILDVAIYMRDEYSPGPVALIDLAEYRAVLAALRYRVNRSSKIDVYTLDMRGLVAEITRVITDVEHTGRAHPAYRYGNTRRRRDGPENLLDECICGPGTLVDRLPGINTDEHPDEKNCNICMEPFGSTQYPEAPAKLPCGHVMGRKCLSKWLETSNTCPLCRHLIVEQWPRSSPHPLSEYDHMFQLMRHRPEQEVHALLGIPAPDPDMDEGEASEDFYVELTELTCQQAICQIELDRFKVCGVALTRRRGRQLHEILHWGARLSTRWDDLVARHPDLIAFHGVHAPSFGRFRGVRGMTVS